MAAIMEGTLISPNDAGLVDCIPVCMCLSKFKPFLSSNFLKKKLDFGSAAVKSMAFKIAAYHGI